MLPPASLLPVFINLESDLRLRSFLHNEDPKHFSSSAWRCGLYQGNPEMIYQNKLEA
jgi:hypothetical protein